MIAPNLFITKKNTLIMNEIIDNVKTKVELPDDPLF